MAVIVVAWTDRQTDRRADYRDIRVVTWTRHEYESLYSRCTTPVAASMIILFLE